MMRWLKAAVVGVALAGLLAFSAPNDAPEDGRALPLAAPEFAPDGTIVSWPGLTPFQVSLANDQRRKLGLAPGVPRAALGERDEDADAYSPPTPEARRVHGRLMRHAAPRIEDGAAGLSENTRTLDRE